jgi:hypothetical protein
MVDAVAAVDRHRQVVVAEGDHAAVEGAEGAFALTGRGKVLENFFQARKPPGGSRKLLSRDRIHSIEQAVYPQPANHFPNALMSPRTGNPSGSQSSKQLQA